MSIAENNTYRVETDGFYGELFTPAEDKFPRKALICFSGSDGRIELAKMLAGVFQAHGLTTLALAYVLEEGLPKQFSRVPIDYIEAAAKRLHGMGYEKVGLWDISKSAARTRSPHVRTEWIPLTRHWSLSPCGKYK